MAFNGKTERKRSSVGTNPAAIALRECTLGRTRVEQRGLVAEGRASWTPTRSLSAQARHTDIAGFPLALNRAMRPTPWMTANSHAAAAEARLAVSGVIACDALHATSGELKIDAAWRASLRSHVIRSTLYLQ